MVIIPEPQPTSPMIIGTGYRRNSPEWEPTIGGKPLSWWSTFFSQLKTDGSWYTVPEEGQRAMQRAHKLLKLGERHLYLHFGEYKGKPTFTIDGYRRYGHRMRNGEFIDWQSGQHRDR